MEGSYEGHEQAITIVAFVADQRTQRLMVSLNANKQRHIMRSSANTLAYESIASNWLPFTSEFALRPTDWSFSVTEAKRKKHKNRKDALGMPHNSLKHKDWSWAACVCVFVSNVQGRIQHVPLGPPAARLEYGYLFFSVVYFSRGTLPTKRVKEHYWGT